MLPPYYNCHCPVSLLPDLTCVVLTLHFKPVCIQAQLALSAADTAEMKSTRIKRRVYDIITQASA